MGLEIDVLAGMVHGNSWLTQLKGEDKMSDLIKKIGEVIRKIIDRIIPSAASTPSVGDVHYRGKPLFPNEAIWLNRDAGLGDGEVTYMDNGKKKYTTPAIWNASIADQKYQIK